MTLNLRVDVNALISVLVSKDVITKTEYLDALAKAIENGHKCMAERFPDVAITDNSIEVNRELAGSWMAFVTQGSDTEILASFWPNSVPTRYQSSYKTETPRFPWELKVLDIESGRGGAI